MHEQRDHRPGPRQMVDRAWSQRMGRHALTPENAERRKRAEAEARLGKQVAARERSMRLAEHGACVRRWVGRWGRSRSIDLQSR